MRHRLTIIAFTLFAAALFFTAAAVAEQGEAIEVAILTFNNGKASRCFAAGFLSDVARETSIPVARQFSTVALDSADLFKHPFVILTGEGKFSLSDTETAGLRAYLQRGGFLLASAGCSNAEFTASFHDAMKKVLPDIAEKPVPTSHPMFHTIYDIDSLGARQNTGERVEIYGMEVEGRLAVVFSPFGLNDSANAGGTCCCCGGNEIRQARQINADILVYALTH